MAVRALIEDDLCSGRLVAPFELRVPTPGAYNLACSQVSSASPQLLAFETWLVQEALDFEKALLQRVPE